MIHLIVDITQAQVNALAIFVQIKNIFISAFRVARSAAVFKLPHQPFKFFYGQLTHIDLQPESGEKVICYIQLLLLIIQLKAFQLGIGQTNDLL